MRYLNSIVSFNGESLIEKTGTQYRSTDKLGDLGGYNFHVDLEDNVMYGNVYIAKDEDKLNKLNGSLTLGDVTDPRSNTKVSLVTWNDPDVVDADLNGALSDFAMSKDLVGPIVEILHGKINYDQKDQLIESMLSFYAQWYEPVVEEMFETVGTLDLTEAEKADVMISGGVEVYNMLVGKFVDFCNKYGLRSECKQIPVVFTNYWNGIY